MSPAYTVIEYTVAKYTGPEDTTSSGYTPETALFLPRSTTVSPSTFVK